MFGTGQQALGGNLSSLRHDVRFADSSSKLVSELGGELSGASTPVNALEQAVHQRAELNDLAVRATDERRSVAVTRATNVSEQLDAGRAI
jgi:hypothetical protein